MVEMEMERLVFDHAEVMVLTGVVISRRGGISACCGGSGFHDLDTCSSAPGGGRASSRRAWQYLSCAVTFRALSLLIFGSLLSLAF